MTGEHLIVVLMLGMTVMFGWFILSMKCLGQKVTGVTLAVMLVANVSFMFYWGIHGWLYAPTEPQRMYCRNMTIMFSVMLVLVGVLMGRMTWNIRRNRKEKKV